MKNNRTIGEINEKIPNGEANIYTAEEFKKLIKNDETPSFNEVFNDTFFNKIKKICTDFETLK